MEEIGILIVGASGVAIVGLVALVISLRRNAKGLRDALAQAEHEKSELAGRLKPALDVEAEAVSLRAALEEERREAEQQSARIKAESDQLRERYAQDLKTYETLEAQVRKLEEDLEDIAYGLYQPHFTYSDTEAYKGAIQSVRDKHKVMTRTGQAATCGTSWTVGGSQREGERMVKQYQRLILRAFNAESEAAIANVAWNNYRVMRERIENAFGALNKLGTVMQISLNGAYKEARLQELQLVFEAAEKRQQEREQQRRLRAEQREEERVQRELQREREEAEKDEAKYEKEIARARRDMEKVRDAEREAMLARIRELEGDLAAAHDRKERAIARAQLTKVGHVYVISNVGAFGEGVLKIGLTRRLDPEERVRELGDASVPFPFDIHALIYSENAPELETKLHNHFWDRRVKWERWYSVHGNGPLKLRLAGGTHTTVGALMMHIFRPERRYVQWMRGELLTESGDIPTNTWEEIFAFGHKTREGLRQFVDEATPEDWRRMHQFIFHPNAHQQHQIRATTRKIIVHVLMHEIRHWAQIARVVREHGMAPPGDHDLLLSDALE